MKVRGHVKLSLLLSVPASFAAGPAAGIIGSIAGGVLIDIDHLLDYFSNYRVTWKDIADRLRKVVNSGSSARKGREGAGPVRRDPDSPLRYYLVFHSYEFWVLLFVLGWKGSPFLLVLSGSALIHLVSDFVVWRLPWYSFFMTYRLLNRFDQDRIQGYKQRLADVGRDINMCQDCGKKGNPELHYEPVGEYHIKGDLSNFFLLCADCHGRRHRRVDQEG